MTIEEAVNIWMPVVAMGVKDMPEVKEAVRMSIASLEAWKKVKREIREYFKEGVMDGDIITTHLCEIIDKHLSEVQNNE